MKRASDIAYTNWLIFLYLFKDWFISALERRVAFTRIPLRERAFWFAPMDKQRKWSVPIRCNLTLKKKFAIYRIKCLKTKKWQDRRNKNTSLSLLDLENENDRFTERRDKCNWKKQHLINLFSFTNINLLFAS